MRSLFVAAQGTSPWQQPGWRLLATGLVCYASVGFALMAQYQWDMLPCPWCTLQRLLYLVVGTVALAAAAWGSPWPRRLLAGLGLLFSLAGMGAAAWQQLVAASSTSCNLTLADKILSALGLFDLAPEVFAPMASCADAAVDLLGLPFAWWSFGLFGACGLMCALSAWRPLPPRG
jgi:disulfide bond formation protein DsbB